MSFRIAVLRLWHEGNSFTPVATRLAGPAAADLAQAT